MKHRLAHRLYRVLLYITPYHLRRSHFREMERLFIEMLEIETRRLGRLGHPYVWFAAIRDVVAIAAAERFGPAPNSHGHNSGNRGIMKHRMLTILFDIRYALRSLAKNPGFAAVAAITLALGIGANTAIFSVVNSVVLTPLAYDAPDQLVRIYGTLASQGVNSGHVSGPDARDWDARSATMSGIATLDWGTADLTGDGDPGVVRAATASANLFTLLGTRPALGRLFVPDDDLAGNERIAVISDGFWRRRFGGDREVIGRTITLDGAQHIVVGVLPPDFEEPSAAGPALMAEVWVPLGTTGVAGSRGTQWLHAVGRLGDQSTLHEAEAELNAIVAALSAEYPTTNAPEAGVRLVSLHESIWGNTTSLLFVLLGATGFVLLIACANIASLVLARGAARSSEMALRTALGAGRWQIVRLLFTESLTLALLAGAAGVITASLLGRWLSTVAEGAVSRVTVAAVDLRVLGFAVIVSIGAAVMFGLFPALSVARTDPQRALKQGGRASGHGKVGRGVRSYLVAGQMALSLVLLIGAGLMVRSVTKLLNVETGFDRQGIFTFQLSLPRARYADVTQISAFQDRLVQRLAALPGVRRAGAVDKLPLGTRWGCTGLAVGDRPIPEGANWPCADSRAATADYFDAMGIALLRGRAFNSSDFAGSAPVVVVNETMARQFWPGEDPLGKRVKWVSDVFNERPWRTVVGLVEDVKHRGLERDAQSEVYMPLHQSPDRRASFVVHTGTDNTDVWGLVRSTVYELDPDLPIREARTIDESIAAAVEQPRLAAALFGALAGVALLLSLIGVYGVLAYFVAQRAHEIGVRMALGANRTQVVRLVLRQGMLMATVGLGIGLAAAFGLTRLLAGFLFEVSALDARTFAVTSVVMLGTAGLASYLPARRATRVDPIVALRSE